MQKVISAKNSFYIVFTLLILANSCVKDKKQSNDDSVLGALIEDEISKSKDSLFYLLEENSNDLIIKRYNMYQKYKDLKSDSIINIVFSKSEYENIKSQSLDSSAWSIEIKNNKNFSFVSERNQSNMFLNHVSKPIYVKNKKYALIYNLKKGKNDIYFMPTIYVYKNLNGSWERVYKIPPRKF